MRTALRSRAVFLLAAASGLVSVTGLIARSEPPLAITPAARKHVSFETAQQALASGDTASADTQFRILWRDPAARPQAAAALRSLHKTPGFRLPADDAVISNALTQLGRGFVRHDTPHFVVLSNCEQRWTQARADVLERARSQFYRVADRMAVDAVPHARKLVCILFSDHAAYMAFATARDGLKSPWVAGYYSPASNRVVFYNDSSGPAYAAARETLDRYRQQVRDVRGEADNLERAGHTDDALRRRAAADDLEAQIKQEEKRLGTLATDASTSKTIHEAVHLLAFNSGVQLPDHDYPFWLSEGFATAFETDKPQSAFGPDRTVSTSRLNKYRELRAAGKLRPTPELITITELSSCDAACAETLYSQSSALFSVLYAKDPAAIGRYFRLLADQPAGRLPAAQQLVLFVSVFGDAGTVDRRMAAAADR